MAQVLGVIALLCAVVSAASPVANLAEAKDDSSLAAMEGSSHQLKKVGDDEARAHSGAGKKLNEEVETPVAKPPSAKSKSVHSPVQKEDEKGAPPKTTKSNKGCADHRPHERCLEWKKEGLCKKNKQVAKDCCGTCK